MSLRGPRHWRCLKRINKPPLALNITEICSQSAWSLKRLCKSAKSLRSLRARSDDTLPRFGIDLRP